MSTTVEERVETTVAVPSVGGREGRRREILLKAAEVVERRGWITGNKGMLANGPVCVLGALSDAMGVPPQEVQMVDLGPVMAYEYTMDLANMLGIRSPDVAFQWNDDFHLALNKESVATVFRKMANGATWDEAISSV